MNRTLLEWWKGSLQALQGKSGLVLAFATLQTIKRAGYLMVRYFWWLLALDITLTVYLAPLTRYTPLDSFGLMSPYPPQLLGISLPLVIYLAVKLMLCAALLFAARASLEGKTAAYFRKYATFMWGYLLIILFQSPFLLFAVPLGWLSLFFYADGKGDFAGLKSGIINGAKGVWFFLPISLLLFGVATALDFGVGMLVRTLAFSGVPFRLVGTVRSVLNFGGLLIVVSMVNSWYLKIKHAHHELFFKK